MWSPEAEPAHERALTKEPKDPFGSRTNTKKASTELEPTRLPAMASFGR
jgi:hypothetical protein